MGAPFRYGVVGTGLMGVEHIENLAVIDGTEVSAICDPNDASLEAARQAVGDEVEEFVDHRDLLEAEVCDALVIATPNHTHIDVLEDALCTDVHVLVEKPLCTTVADCRRVVDLAEGRDAVTWVGLEYRYMPPVARLIDEVGGGMIGRLHMLAIREHRFPFLPKVDDWNRLNRNTGGTLVEKCCHFFDLMNLIVGDRPVSVMASGGQDVNHLDERYGGERADILDNAYVIVEYPGGERAMLDLCMFAEATKHSEEVVAVGDQGKIEALLPQSVIRIGRRGEHFVGNVRDIPVQADDVGHEGYHHGASYLEHVAFLDAVRSEAPPAVTVEDGLWSVAIGVAAHRSIDEGRSVELAEVIEG